MPSTPVIAILDVGKTNKKFFLFDASYKIVWEETTLLTETRDEDGFACEDLDLLSNWVRASLTKAGQSGDFDVRAVNFSAYGASFVYIGEDGNPIAPIYNYLKPYPEKIKKQFYDQYAGELRFAMQTASPVLGNLNSGMQLYRLKYENPEKFSRIKYALHLPQYLCWLITRKACSDISSIGCHTNLWDFSKNYYHEWVYREAIIEKLAPIQSSGMVYPVLRNEIFPFSLRKECVAGIGLHDSSAAMIPYLENFRDPFVLISTGTWNISMNPFNKEPLTITELQNDCLCYLTYKGSPLKSSRLFAGNEHSLQVEKLSEYFQKDKAYFQSVSFDPGVVAKLQNKEVPLFIAPASGATVSVFAQRDISGFQSFEEAYHRLQMDIMDQQIESTKWILSDSVNRIFVDGGFGKNPVYMHLLAAAFPAVRVFAAKVAQASALGAAMAVHEHWNDRPVPEELIGLTYYPNLMLD
jgi:L-fuculokinase